MLGQVTPRQQPGAFPLPSRLLQSLEDEADLQQLLRLAASAVSRLQSHALSSLQQTGTLENGNLQTSWQTEVPIRHGQEFVPLQLKLQREETPSSKLAANVPGMTTMRWQRCGASSLPSTWPRSARYRCRRSWHRGACRGSCGPSRNARRGSSTAN